MLIHFDNFNLYGGDAANVLSFYSEFTGVIADDPDTEATGKVAQLGPGQDDILKKYLNHSNGASHGVGINAQIMLSSLPTSAGGSFDMMPRIMQWSGIGGLSVGYDEIMYVVVLTTGHIMVTQSRSLNPSFTLGITDKPVVIPGVWQNFEAYYFSALGTDATFELRLEGETILYADNFGSVIFEDNTHLDPTIVGVSFSSRDNVIGAGPAVYVKNAAFWNMEGTENNTFLGPLIVQNMLPSTDVDDGSWVPVGGASLSDVLNDVPFSPSVYALAAPAASVENGGLPFTVEISDSPVGWDILGVLAFCAHRKNDRGYASSRITITSGASEGAGAELFPTMDTATVFEDFSLDPATGSIWTLSALNAARFKMDRLT